MVSRSINLAAMFVAALIIGATPARAQDVALCFGTADRVAGGETVDEEAKRLGHAACQRAIAQTSSVVQKYHLQEADFDIIGRPPKS